MKKKIVRKLLFTLVLLMFAIPVFSMNTQAKAIYTGNKKTDQAVEAIIIRACGKKYSTMTNKQKLKASYKYLVKHMTYSHSDGRVKIKPTAAEKKIYAENLAALKLDKNITYSKKFKSDWRNVRTMRGTCKDMAGVMCIIANHLGFKAGYCHGRYVRSNGSSVDHHWNYIVVNGKKKYCDVQAANDGGHSWSRIKKYYLRSRSSSFWRKHYRF